jgi:hypothetical protein
VAVKKKEDVIYGLLNDSFTDTKIINKFKGIRDLSSLYKRSHSRQSETDEEEKDLTF